MLRWVVTRSAVVAVVATLGSLGFRDLSVTLGVGLGAVLALANFWALRWLMGRIVDRAAEGRARAGGLLAFKFVLLAAAVFLLLRTVSVSPIALAVGLSVVVLVIMAGPVLGPPVSATTEE